MEKKSYKVEIENIYLSFIIYFQPTLAERRTLWYTNEKVRRAALFHEKNIRRGDIILNV